jgi:hypothetical protein
MISGANIQESLTTGVDGSWSPLPLPTGEYTFTASAPAYGIWPAPRRLSLTPPASITLTLAPPINEIASGDFEGNQVWQVWEWPNGQITLSIDAFDGQAAVRLGDGSGAAAPCATTGQPGQLWTLQQSVTVPPDGVPTLSFLYKITPNPTTFEQAWLEVAVAADGQTQPLVSPGELWPAPDWTMAVHDLSTWRGQTVALQFQVWRCSEQLFSANLDRISLGSTPGP